MLSNSMEAEKYKDEANEFFKAQKYPEAIDLYSKAIEINPSVATFYSNRAAAYLNTGEFKKALNDCQQAISLDPTMVKAYFRAVKSNIHLGNLDEAAYQLSLAEKLPGKNISNHAQTLAKDKSTVNTLKMKLDLYAESMSSERYYEALQAIESAMVIVDPSLYGTGYPNCKLSLILAISDVETSKLANVCVKWRIYRAEALIGCWDVQEAGQVAAALIRSAAESKNPEAICIRAKTMHLLESHPVSTIIQYLSTSLQYDPDNKKSRVFYKHIKNLEALKTKGNDFFKANNWEEAIAAYNEFLEADPKGGVMKAKVLSNRAIVYSRYDKVIEDCGEALELLNKLCFPKDFMNGMDVSHEDKANSTQQALYSKLYLRLADAYNKKEEYEDAVRSYEAALAMDPGNNGNLPLTIEIKSALRNAKQALKISKRKDYYKILGIDKSASESEIKKAYRKLALQYHPGTILLSIDKRNLLPEAEQGNADSRFKEIQEAYEVLSDERKKSLFDAGHDIDGSSASAGQGFHSHDFGGVNLADLFGGGGFGGFHQFGGGNGFRSQGFGGQGYGGHGFQQSGGYGGFGGYGYDDE
ncbi:DnaJ sub C member 7 [Boothiomyces macroporosus]|uniref:DnaJ sub C member 7 n=1 Tax=Boothiomyces macroporosus TaxID=261099 RepID=A0AAD5U916_9FUNG|nr:DnaJ sub C member 7 [Boothiomyces macroporosus]